MTEFDLLLRPTVALLAGGLVGLERTYHGRAAGLRTYALVAMGSALLVAIAQFLDMGPDLRPGDPTRVIQGIVTGIGFLGAGVIVKEGFTVRGLTTAASIWVVSATGIAIGAGFLVAGATATALTLAALALLRRVEDRMSVQSFVHCRIAFRREQINDDDWVRQLVERFGFTITELSYRLDGKSNLFEYKMVMWSADPDACRNFGRALLALPQIADFHLSPSRD